MKKLFIVKCPDCHAVLKLKADTEKLPEHFACPACKVVHDFSAYEPVDDKTMVVTTPAQSRPGYLVDDAGNSYPLREGVQTVGRASASEVKPDIPIPTDDHGLSRIHLTFDVRLCADGEYHHYVSLAKAQNETAVAGRILRPGDAVALSSGDTISCSKTVLHFVEVKV